MDFKRLMIQLPVSELGDDSTFCPPVCHKDIDQLLLLVECKIPVQDEGWDELTNYFSQGTTGIV